MKEKVSVEGVGGGWRVEVEVRKPKWREQSQIGITSFAALWGLQISPKIGALLGVSLGR